MGKLCSSILISFYTHFVSTDARICIFTGENGTAFGFPFVAVWKLSSFSFLESEYSQLPAPRVKPSPYLFHVTFSSEDWWGLKDAVSILAYVTHQDSGKLESFMCQEKMYQLSYIWSSWQAHTVSFFFVFYLHVIMLLSSYNLKLCL